MHVGKSLQFVLKMLDAFFLLICILSVDSVFLIIPAIKCRKDCSIFIQMEKEVHILHHLLVGKRKEFY